MQKITPITREIERLIEIRNGIDRTIEALKAAARTESDPPRQDTGEPFVVRLGSGREIAI